jgi:hypothetical protein
VYFEKTLEGNMYFGRAGSNIRLFRVLFPQEGSQQQVAIRIAKE